VHRTNRAAWLRDRRSRSLRRAKVAALLLAGILFFSLSCFASDPDQTFHHVYPLAAGGNFALENVNGSVSVEGWDRDEVDVSAVKTARNDPSDAEAVKIEVDSGPNCVSVHTRYPKGDGAEVAVDYHVRVPYRVLLGHVETVNGSVIIRGIEGSGELHSVNGNVEVTNSSGRFNAKTTNGNLRLELRRLLDGAPMNLETVNGSVVLGLPRDARANVKVLSMNGEVDSDLPVISTASTPATRAYTGRIGTGTGGGDIFVHTVNGGVRLVLWRPGV